jgi:putative tryptophan/tyrosine transport system substrate-binding protein
MRRRDFITILGGAAAWPLAVRAQDGMRKIGFVSWWSPTVAVYAEEFRKGLAELGYLEGRDFEIEAHFTEGDPQLTRDAIRRMVADGADILVVQTTPAIRIAQEEAGELPIVMGPVADAIAGGFAESLARPGGNLTGLTMFGPNLAGKRIQYLKELRPSLETVAFLGSSTDQNTPTFVAGTQAAADASDVQLNVHLVEGPSAIDASTFEAIRQGGAEAVIVQPIFMGNQEKIVPLATAAGLPVISDYSLFAEAGAVLTYGIDDLAQMHRAAYYVDRIFKGDDPAELPIEQPTEFRLAINLDAADHFGWTVPPSLLAQADELIE